MTETLDTQTHNVILTDEAAAKVKASSSRRVEMTSACASPFSPVDAPV